MSIDTLAPAIRQDGFFSESLASADPEIFGAIGNELKRQQDKIELIASENIVSKAVLEAAGSIFTNKYAEGYPASAIMAAANMPMWSKRWRSSAPSNCSAPISPMCSPIAAAR